MHPSEGAARPDHQRAITELERGAESRAVFHVVAAADPSVLPRLVHEFAKRNLVPDKWHSVVTGPGADELHVDIQVSGVDTATGARLAAVLQRLVDVQLVLRAGA